MSLLQGWWWVIDKYGNHAIVCAGQNDCSTRHNAVRDRLAGAAIDGQFSLVIEKNDVLVDGSQSKPADIYVPFWSYGKPLAIDVLMLLVLLLVPLRKM